jgi:hypothetical protein
VRCQAPAAAAAVWTPPAARLAAPGGRRPGAAAPPAAPAADLSCELLQGNMVRFTAASDMSVPTAVLVHGILGSRRNLQSFARMILEVRPPGGRGGRARRGARRGAAAASHAPRRHGRWQSPSAAASPAPHPAAHRRRPPPPPPAPDQGFPSWQVLLVDLRCHGDSAAAAGAPPAPGPHTVDAAAQDVLELLRRRRAFPNMLIGHSFGGKARGARGERPARGGVVGGLSGRGRRVAGGRGRA